MANDYPSIGALSKVSFAGTAMAVLSCGVGMRQVILQREGLRGTRSRYAQDTRKGIKRIGGTTVMEPSPAELAILMPYLIGTGGAVAEVLNEYAMIVDRGASRGPYTYSGCHMARGELSGAQGGAIRFSFDTVGKAESVAGSVSTPASAAPYLFGEVTLNLSTVASCQVFDFSLVVDNHIDTDRFLNSLTLPRVVELDRTVLLTVNVPDTQDNKDLYDIAEAGLTGTNTLVINDGVTTKTFTFGTLKAPPEQPEIRGKGETPLTLNFQSFKDGSTPEIAFA